MKITGIEAIRINLPYASGIIRKYRPKPHPTTILKVYTDEGIIGLGESLHASEEQIKFCASAIVGKNPLEMDLLNLDLPMPALSAYEQALYDLVGKKLKLPVCKLLGGGFKDKVPLAYFGHEMTVEETVSEAEFAVEKGFKVFKFKAWTPSTVAERVKAVYKAVGEELALRLEANYAWRTPAKALTVMRKVEGYNVECVEDPVPYNPDWYVLLRRKAEVPIAIHFENRGAYPRPKEILNAVKFDACDFMNIAGPDFHVGFKMGAAIAEMAGIPIWHGGHLGSAILDSAFAHVCASVRNKLMPCDLLHYFNEDDLIVEPLKVKDGYLEVPKGPGLGVELDEEAVKKYEVKRFKFP